MKGKKERKGKEKKKENKKREINYLFLEIVIHKLH
jgi:hypothetical protein